MVKTYEGKLEEPPAREEKKPVYDAHEAQEQHLSLADVKRPVSDFLKAVRDGLAPIVRASDRLLLSDDKDLREFGGVLYDAVNDIQRACEAEEQARADLRVATNILRRKPRT